MSTRDEDAAWQQIVDNYGEQPEIPVVEPESDRSPAEPHRFETDEPGGVEPFRIEMYDEEFVPPPLPPPTTMRPERRVAWCALIGSPVLLMVFTLLDLAIPPVLTAGLVLAFLGSFGYLVATMEPHDPDDDGARV